MNLAIWIPEWVERLGWVLLHFVWQGLLIGILSWAGMSLLKKSSAQSRYLLLCASLLCCILCPCITWTILGDKARSDNPSIGYISFDPKQAHVTSASAPSTTDITPEITTQKLSPSFDQTFVRFEGLVVPGLPYLVTIWSVGVMLLSLRLLFGWLQLKRLCASGVPVEDRTWGARLNLLSEKMGIRSKITLLESMLIEIPTVIGSMRPVILVPLTFMTGLPTDQIEAILAHELAHIRRHDYIVNLIQIALETLLFYHPAVWWISNSIRVERENCCDDLALRVIGNKTVYVSALAALEESRSLPMAITMSATGGSLIQRIRRIMGVGGGKDSSCLVLVALLFVALATSGAAWEAKQHGPAGQTNEIVPPRVVQITGQVIEGNKSDFDLLGLGWLASTKVMGFSGTLTPEAKQAVLNGINQKRNIILLPLPIATCPGISSSKVTISTPFPSEQVHPRFTGGKFDGIVLTAVPVVETNGKTIDLDFSAQITRNGVTSVEKSSVALDSSMTACLSVGDKGGNGKYTLLFITAKIVDPNQHVVESIAKVLIVKTRFVEMGETNYTSHKDEVDHAIGSGEWEKLTNMEGAYLCAAPTVTTKNGMKTLVKISDDIAYPTQLKKSANGGWTPLGTKVTDIGISVEMTPTWENGKIALSGVCRDTTLEGMVKGTAGFDTPTFTTKESYFLEALKDGQTVGFMVPGNILINPAKLDLGDKATSPVRLFIFISAKTEDEQLPTLGR